MKTLIKDVYLTDGSVQSIEIEDDKILHVGEGRSDFLPDKIIDGKDKLAIPGFVNAHTHVSMTLLRSVADDKNLMDWLQQDIWPLEEKMDAEDIYSGAMLGILEMIRGGTTCFADMYGPFEERVAEAVLSSGIRASLARGLIGYSEGAEEKLQEGINLYKNFHGKGNITVMLAPHAVYTSPPDYLKKVGEAAKKIGAHIHTHLSETKDEVANCLRDTGKTPAAHMESLGLLECGALAAHCVHLTDEDVAVMKRRKVHIVHNPGSNMKLASGAMDTQRILDAGFTVALGTDGASSNNNLDMLEETRLAALLAKVSSLSPTALPAKAALHMATKAGAEALYLDDLGSLKEGQKADIALFSMDAPYWYPRTNLLSLFIYAANSRDAETVLVNGKILMEKGEIKTMDEERILHEAEKSARHLMGA